MSQTQPDNEHLQQFIDAVADMLNETQPRAKHAIGLVVRRAGPQKTMKILRRVLEIEQKDGLLTCDGSRRRTPGGVFFFLAKGRYYLPMGRKNQRRPRQIETTEQQIQLEKVS
jgi:hypothetical protein